MADDTIGRAERAQGSESRPGPKRLRVGLCVSSTLLRDLLAERLSAEEDLEIVSELRELTDLARAAAPAAVDLVLLDLDAPGHASALNVVRELRRSGRGPKFIGLSASQDRERFLAALAAGLAGYRTMNSSVPELVDAIRETAAGHTRVSASLSRARPERVATPLDDLSARESEVLLHIALGYTSKEAAELLSLRSTTIDTYRHRVMAKLGVNNRAGLVKLALEAGLLTPEGHAGSRHASEARRQPEASGGTDHAEGPPRVVRARERAHR